MLVVPLRYIYACLCIELSIQGQSLYFNKFYPTHHREDKTIETKPAIIAYCSIINIFWIKQNKLFKPFLWLIILHVRIHPFKKVYVKYCRIDFRFDQIDLTKCKPIQVLLWFQYIFVQPYSHTHNIQDLATCQAVWYCLGSMVWPRRYGFALEALYYLGSTVLSRNYSIA